MERTHIYISRKRIRRLFYDCEKKARKMTIDKVAIEAYALSLMAKDRFVSSMIVKPTYRHLCEIFGLGHDRLKRILEKCKEMGLVYTDKYGNLIFRAIHSSRYRHKFDCLGWNGKFKDYFKAVYDFYTEQLSKMQEDIADSHLNGNVKRIKAMGMADTNLRRGLSCRSLAKTLGVSRTTAMKSLQTLTDKNILKRRRIRIKTKLPLVPSAEDLQEYCFKHNHYGHFFTRKGRVWVDCGYRYYVVNSTIVKTYRVKSNKHTKTA